MIKKGIGKCGIRYSLAFQLEMVRLLEAGDISYQALGRRYGVHGMTLARWVYKHGNGSIGKVIKVQMPKEIDEVKALKDRVRQLEKVVADLNIEVCLEQAYTEMACERAGIKDVEEFKKKATGKRGIVR
jgi:transposase-like protein